MKCKLILWAAVTLAASLLPGVISASNSSIARKSYSVDICIYGGTSAGVIAAYAAWKCGKTVILIEPGKLLGGMTTGGLGKTDAGKKQAITGLSRLFYTRVGQQYGQSDEQWTFEPRVALKVMQGFLSEGNIKTLLQTEILKVTKNGTVITSAKFRDMSGRTVIQVKAKEFLDCTYEGDLMAKAGVSYVVGREDNKQYNETLNGFQLAAYHKQSGYHQFPDGVSPYKVPGDPASGLVWGIAEDHVRPTGSGDKQIQAYNFRICLTDSAQNRIPITRPGDYDSSKYVLLARLFQAQPTMRKINDYFIWSKMPNHKTDINNRGGFSTDMIGMNYKWPEASYRERDKMLQEAISYTKGLLYFMQSDERVPESLRSFVKQWGYPKDEYQQFGHFTPQLYIREGRRMVGEYVMTEHNCRGQVTVKDGIGLASYGMDSHNCERIVVNGMVKNEGNVEVGVPHPYPISYHALTPKPAQCTNLLVPVCLSATHISYGSIRMEPVFMVLGQSAAMAAVMAIDEKTSVQKIDVGKLQQWLKDDPYLKTPVN